MPLIYDERTFADGLTVTLQGEGQTPDGLRVVVQGQAPASEFHKLQGRILDVLRDANLEPVSQKQAPAEHSGNRVGAVQVLEGAPADKVGFSAARAPETTSSGEG